MPRVTVRCVPRVFQREGSLQGLYLSQSFEGNMSNEITMRGSKPWDHTVNRQQFWLEIAIGWVM